MGLTTIVRGKLIHIKYENMQYYADIGTRRVVDKDEAVLIHKLNEIAYGIREDLWRRLEVD